MNTTGTHVTDELKAAAFDALTAPVAVVDDVGTIVAVNRAWVRFAERNGGDLSATGVGANYLDVCSRAADADDEDAATVLAGLAQILGGRRDRFEYEYPCHSPDEQRWFILQAAPAAVAGRLGAVVFHVNVTRRKWLENLLAHRATHDPLTGLPNRQLLFDRMELARARARRAGRGLAVLYIDLDAFKDVNDHYGHTVGDEVLTTVATRLAGTIRDSDTLARVGGDEFIVLCEEAADPESITRLVERIEHAVAAPIPVGFEDVRLGASIGTATASGHEPPEEIITEADGAMYAVKQARGANRDLAGPGSSSGTAQA